MNNGKNISKRSNQSIIENIEIFALGAGFDLVSIAKAEVLEKESVLLDENISKGYYGNMKWLEETAEKRKNIFKVMPDAKSVICVALNYCKDTDIRMNANATNPPQRTNGKIARYAYGRDYHKIFDKKLKVFSQKLKTIFPEGNFKYYSDTGPIMDRAFAAHSGLGFIGKNTNLITKYGSWVLLGEIVTDVYFNIDNNDAFSEPQFATPAMTTVTGSAKNLLCEQNQSFSPAPVSSKASLSSMCQVNNCGSCRKCIDVCPTGALESHYVVNASKCISYLTIEHKGDIPLELRDKMGSWIFGCDACQEVCPFNVGRQKKGSDFELTEKAIAGSVQDLKEILAIKTDEEFLEKFAGSPVMRAKRRGLVRNACIAAGNSGDVSLLPYLKECLKDNEEVIVSHAKWAIEKLEKVIKLS